MELEQAIFTLLGALVLFFSIIFFADFIEDIINQKINKK